MISPAAAALLGLAIGIFPEERCGDTDVAAMWIGFRWGIWGGEGFARGPVPPLEYGEMLDVLAWLRETVKAQKGAPPAVMRLGIWMRDQVERRTGEAAPAPPAKVGEAA